MTRTLSSPAFGPPRFFRRPAWLSLLALGLVAALIAFPYLWRAWVDQRYSRHIYALDTALAQEAHARVAVVYGARVYAGGRLSGMFRDRVDTAIALYKAGKVDKLLLSGDNQTLEYDEPGAMLAYAAAQGVPLEDLQPDYGGRRTYDTCYRARHVFQLDAAVLVTQEFHLGVFKMSWA